MMFRDREEIRRRIQEIVEKFRQKGATDPEKALTPAELGLPPRFEQAMHRRLGQTGIFVEVNGKYYLSEERLRQIQEQRGKGGSGDGMGSSSGKGSAPGWMRVAGILLMLPIGIFIALVLFYFVSLRGGGYFPGEFLIILLVIALGLFAARLLFWRSRRRYWRGQWGERSDGFS
jgi:hypothetical protein